MDEITLKAMNSNEISIRNVAMSLKRISCGDRPSNVISSGIDLLK
jgi:hypothetical protein